MLLPFAILLGCGDEGANTIDPVDILADITVEEVATDAPITDNGLPNWERTPESDIAINTSHIDFEKYNEHFTVGYKHRRWDAYIQPDLSNIVCVGDYLYIPDGHGVNIFKFDLQGNFIERVATRPSLSNRRPTTNHALNKPRRPITDGIRDLAVSPDGSNIYATIVWSPGDNSRPHYINLVSWIDGEVVGGDFTRGNAYNHWEPSSDNGYPDPPWNHATFRLGTMLYLGDTLVFLGDNQIWDTQDNTLITLDVIPDIIGSVFTTETHIYIGDISHQVFTYQGVLVGTIDLEDIVDSDGKTQGYIRKPFYVSKHQTLYALYIDYQSDIQVFYAFKSA